jgi:hypothetical protein
LHGQGRHRGDAVAIVRGKRFQVGRNAGTTRGIESSNGKDDRESRSMLVIAQTAGASRPGTTAGCAEREEQANKPDCTRAASRPQDFFRGLSEPCVLHGSNV